MFRPLNPLPRKLKRRKNRLSFPLRSKKKQELTQRYEKFLVQIERVRNLIEDVSEQNTEIADFENDKTAYRLCLMTPSNYRDDPAFCVTNAELIDNVLCLLLARMEIKSNDLRAELTA